MSFTGSYLDRYDEKRSSLSDAYKWTTSFTLDSSYIGIQALEHSTLEEFCLAANLEATEDRLFELSDHIPITFQNTGESIIYDSPFASGFKENDTVRVAYSPSNSKRHAVVLLHHWNATKSNRLLSKVISFSGISVAELPLPYHFGRKISNPKCTNLMLSPSLGRTIHSFRQAVQDVKLLISILKNIGYERISVLGFSLGSWVAAIVAATDPRVHNASLFLTAGSLADMVWTGRATRHIRQSFDGMISQEQLNMAWAPLNIENYVDRLKQNRVNLQLIFAARDKVVLPELSKTLVDRISRSRLSAESAWLNAGHYSIALPPFGIRASLMLLRFFHRP